MQSTSQNYWKPHLSPSHLDCMVITRWLTACVGEFEKVMEKVSFSPVLNFMVNSKFAKCEEFSLGIAFFELSGRHLFVRHSWDGERGMAMVFFSPGYLSGTGVEMYMMCTEVISLYQSIKIHPMWPGRKQASDMYMASNSLQFDPNERGFKRAFGNAFAIKSMR